MSIDNNNDGEYSFFDNDIEPDEGEGNSIIDCGESNIDEYDETLPLIHIKDFCNVIILNSYYIIYL